MSKAKPFFKFLHQNHGNLEWFIHFCFPQIAFAILGLLRGGGCHLGCHWWCPIADVVGRCRGGCCVGCRCWCSIAGLGGRCCAGRWLGVFLVGCDLGCCWWYVNGMWLGGVAQDMVGGVLWRGFLVLRVSHIHSRILQIQSDYGKKDDAFSCYFGSMMVYCYILFASQHLHRVLNTSHVQI